MCCFVYTFILSFLFSFRYGFTHLSTGDLLREEVASGSAKGKALNEIMVSGKLVTNELVLDLLASAIQKHQATATGFLIDGYPREVMQHNLTPTLVNFSNFIFLHLLNQVNQAIEFEAKVAPASVILYFHCSDKEMTDRLLNRGKTSGRADDNEATIKKRLDTFHAHTQPILDHYKPKGKLETINSERPVDAVYADVEGVVKKVLGK